MIGRRDIVLIGDAGEIAAMEPRDLLVFFGTSEVTRFILGTEDDPAKRGATDVGAINAAANLSAQQLPGSPAGDALGGCARLEFVREHVKSLPVAVRLLPDMRVRTLSNYASSARSARPAPSKFSARRSVPRNASSSAHGPRYRQPGADVLPADHGAHGDRHQA